MSLELTAMMGHDVWTRCPLDRLAYSCRRTGGGLAVRVSGTNKE